MKAKIDKPPEIYQLHILLLKINPPIWRRILVRSDSSIADLHYTLQIAFDWSDFHLHRFLIHGKEYGIGRSGCTCFSTDAKAVCLADFSFRRNERFLYEYDFGDLWEHQVRVEGVQPIQPKKVYPVCIAGSRAAPTEDCGGPEAYMDRMDEHWLDPPLDELLLISETLERVLNAKEEQAVREVLCDPEEFKEAVERLEAYTQFRPDHLDRRKLNRRLKFYAEGNEKWMGE